MHWLVWVRHVPQPYGSVVASGGQGAAIRAEHRRQHLFGGQGGGVHWLVWVRHVPQPYGLSSLAVARVRPSGWNTADHT